MKLWQHPVLKRALAGVEFNVKKKKNFSCEDFDRPHPDVVDWKPTTPDIACYFHTHTQKISLGQHFSLKHDAKRDIFHLWKSGQTVTWGYFRGFRETLWRREVALITTLLSLYKPVVLRLYRIASCWDDLRGRAGGHVSSVISWD